MSSKDLLIISIFTFITVVAWIVFDVHHATTTSTITPLQEELIKPLESTFDQEIILKLKKRKEI